MVYFPDGAGGDHFEEKIFKGPLGRITRDALSYIEAQYLKELDLTEGRSTGLPKIFRKMAHNGSPKPIFKTDKERSYFLVRLPVHEKVVKFEHVTAHVTELVERLLFVLERTELGRQELMRAVSLNHRQNFMRNYLNPGLDEGLIEMTIPGRCQPHLSHFSNN